ncbi:GNAT family N-acetyltransferase [Opitutus sp. ER46]|uniref:GNAT family N-acetyltransferase n=1 Tax=Opitutus sp. ER46 TaxID=2161864 RepID=UPI001305034F|nr:GNAT family N-acetyltransferase [Opitutus sp. ER46]
MHGILTTPDGGVAHGAFGPDGLFAHPSNGIPSPRSLAQAAYDVLEAHGLGYLLWHVRFDHGELAAVLHRAGFSSTPYATHVLSLGQSHADLFAAYRKTRRNEIRQSQKKGCIIREATTYDDVLQYCAVHAKLAQQKEGFRVKYPAELIFGLLQLPQPATLSLAEVSGQVVAGALFIPDGDSVFYWHGAADRDFSDYFPTGALVDHGIQAAVARGAKSLNFGASGSDSLRDFKASFGAKPASNWTFTIGRRESLRTRLGRSLRRLFQPTRPVSPLLIVAC